ncbi:hypothetical protein JL722_2291 [Aureococcus anophagefferens]|nr:hypothetical protein JL722_2291 [Aureococcus anophagefferens]
MGNVTRMLALVVLARVVAQDEDANARMLPFHSFVAPFVAMAPNTMRRTVSDEWTAYGDTEVLQSFARLTPEKGKSVGALWSNFPVGDAAASDRLSVVLRIGVSGATGASADVHDVLSLETFADSRARPPPQQRLAQVPPGGAPVDDARLAKIEDMVNWMTFKLEHLNHVFEHSTAAFANAVDRGGDEFGLLVADEADRLAALERVVDERLKEKIEDRFEKLQGEFDALFEEKLNHAHTGLAASLERNLHAEVSPFDGAWRTPFQTFI